LASFSLYFLTRYHALLEIFYFALNYVSSAHLGWLTSTLCTNLSKQEWTVYCTLWEICNRVTSSCKTHSRSM